jgi:hypothetical protein
MKAETYISSVSITVNTHDLLGVPSDESLASFIEYIWNYDFGRNWKLRESSKTHYEVTTFSFDVNENNMDGINNVRKVIEGIAELILKTYK